MPVTQTVSKGRSMETPEGDVPKDVISSVLNTVVNGCVCLQRDSPIYRWTLMCVSGVVYVVDHATPLSE